VLDWDKEGVDIGVTEDWTGLVLDSGACWGVAGWKGNAEAFAGVDVVGIVVGSTWVGLGVMLVLVDVIWVKVKGDVDPSVVLRFLRLGLME
jgi:hypothetical protein